MVIPRGLCKGFRRREDEILSPLLFPDSKGEMTSPQVHPSGGLLSNLGPLLLLLSHRLPEPSLETEQTWELVGTKDTTHQCLGGAELVNPHPSQAEANLGGPLEAARLEGFAIPSPSALVPSGASVGSRTRRLQALVHRLQGGLGSAPALRGWSVSHQLTDSFCPWRKGAFRSGAAQQLAQLLERWPELPMESGGL